VSLSIGEALLKAVDEELRYIWAHHRPKPTIRVAATTLDDIENYLHSKSTEMGDFALSAEGLTQYRGCKVVKEPSWDWGIAVIGGVDLIHEARQREEAKLRRKKKQ